MKYLGMCLFLLAGNEIISLAALLAMTAMFLWDIASERSAKYE